jgi:hypothetical protein
MAVKSEFGKAFADARKSGLKTFEFKGKKYTTELAKPSKPVKAELGPEMGQRMTSAESEAVLSGFGNPSGSASRVSKETPQAETYDMSIGIKRGGAVKKMASGGSASSRADGCAVKGKTRGRMI